MTAEEFHEWATHTDWDRRFELIDGKPVERPLEGVQHGFVCGRVCCVIGDYLIETGTGYGCSNNSGLIVARSPDTVLGPDLMAFRERITDLRGVEAGFAARPPALVVEVLSDNDRPAEMAERVRRFLAAGVPLVWTVDPADRTVTEHRTGAKKTLRGGELVEGHDALPGMQCKAADFFRAIGQP
jgi:Uma2 family endonuclease